MMKDGWHTIAGYSVYVEGNLVRRGTLGEGVNYRSAAVYRRDRENHRQWIKETMTVDAFRAGVKRGTVKLA